MSNPDKWVLEIYRAIGSGDHITTVEFESLPLYASTGASAS
jgi:hypothetical protein